MKIVRPLKRVRTGFTMIELLVVIAIIAILAAILFPVFAQAREKTRQFSCGANLQQISMALRIYARDYDGRLPARHNDLSPLVVPYINGILVLSCPSDTQGVSFNGQSVLRSSPAGNMTSELFPMPAGVFGCSYQYHGGFTLDTPGDTPVAADWNFLHQDRACVVNLTGEVRRLARSEWTPVAPGPRPFTGKGTSGPPIATPFLAVPWKAPIIPKAATPDFSMMPGGGP